MKGGGSIKALLRLKALWRLYEGFIKGGDLARRRVCLFAHILPPYNSSEIYCALKNMRMEKILKKKLKNKNKSKVHPPLFVLPCSDFAHAAHRGNHSAVDPIVIVNGRQPLVLLQNNTHDARREKYQLSQHVPLQFVPTKSQRTYVPFSFLLLWAFFFFFLIFLLLFWYLLVSTLASWQRRLVSCRGGADLFVFPPWRVDWRLVLCRGGADLSPSEMLIQCK